MSPDNMGPKGRTNGPNLVQAVAHQVTPFLLDHLLEGDDLESHGIRHRTQDLAIRERASPFRVRQELVMGADARLKGCQRPRDARVRISRDLIHPNRSFSWIRTSWSNCLAGFQHYSTNRGALQGAPKYVK